MTIRATAASPVRYVIENELVSLSGARWFAARESASGAEVLAIDVKLDAAARKRLALANDILGAWPAFAMPLGEELTPRGTTLVAYPEHGGHGPASLGEDDALAITVEVLELLEAAHAREIVHPGIDPIALVVAFDTRARRLRARLRGLGLPAKKRTPADDVADLARCVSHLFTTAAGPGFEATRFGSVLQRALGGLELRFTSARAMRDAMVLPRSGRRVRQSTSMLKSASREEGTDDNPLLPVPAVSEIAKLFQVDVGFY